MVGKEQGWGLMEGLGKVVGILVVPCRLVLPLGIAMPFRGECASSETIADTNMRYGIRAQPQQHRHSKWGNFLRVIPTSLQDIAMLFRRESANSVISADTDMKSTRDRTIPTSQDSARTISAW